MKKTYTTPEVTVTKWMSEDVITTSGVTASTAPLTTDVTEGIKTVSYDSLQ